MLSLLLYRILVLSGFVVWVNSIPCSLGGQDGCTSCTKWTEVDAGNLFCKYRKEFPNSEKSDMTCRRIKHRNRICVEERRGWQRCEKKQSAVIRSANEIQRKFDFKYRQLKELNGKIDWETPSQKAQSICIAGSYPENCHNMYIPDGKETCTQVADKFDISVDEFNELNPVVVCKEGDAALPENAVCVEDSECAYRHLIRIEDTCAKLMRAYKIHHDDLMTLNPNLTCNQLPYGKKICVWPTTSRPVPDMTCTDWHKIEPYDTCLSITLKTGATIDNILFLNPTFECEKLHSFGQKLCTHGKSSPKCARIVHVPPNSTCRELFVKHGAASPEIFFENNPLVQCDKLNETQQICGGTGFFEITSCGNYLMSYTEGYNLSLIIESPPFNISEHDTFETCKQKLLDLNPELDGKNLPESLPRGTLICTKRRDADEMDRLRILASTVSIRSSLMINALYLFETNPSFQTEKNMQNTFTQELKKEFVLSLLKYEQSTNATVRRALKVDDELGRRKSICQFLGNSSIANDELRRCFCEHTEPFIYCNALFADVYSNVKISEPETESGLSEEKKIRKKRFTCSLDISGFEFAKSDSDKKEPATPSKESSSKKEEKTPNEKKWEKADTVASVAKAIGVGELCIGGGCAFPVVIFEVKVKAGGCISPLDTAATLAEFLFEPTERGYTDQIDSTLIFLSTQSEQNFYVTIQFCLAGSDIVEKLGIDPCILTIKLTFYYQKGLLQILMQVALSVIAVSWTSTLKLYDVAPDWDRDTPNESDGSICKLDKFRCNDFCIWRRNGESNFPHHGALVVTLDLWLWSIPIPIPGASNYPTSNGCDAGDKPFIVITNLRECETYVEVRCSGLRFFKLQMFRTRDVRKNVNVIKSWVSSENENGQKRYLIGHGQKREFQIEDVDEIYACRIHTRNGNQFADIDVFRGHGPRGNIPHYFFLQNDDSIVYSKYPEPTKKQMKPMGKLKASYCDYDRIGDPEDAEPRNRSTIECARCFKRQVYYSCRRPANKPFTEKQPKQFTHMVIEDVKLNWDHKEQLVEKRDLARGEAYRKDLRYSGGGAFLLFSIDYEQPFFRNKTIFDMDRKNYVSQLGQVMLKLKVDGIDINAKNAPDQDLPTTEDLKNLKVFVRDLARIFLDQRWNLKRRTYYVLSISFRQDRVNDTTYQLADLENDVDFITFDSDISFYWYSETEPVREVISDKMTRQGNRLDYLNAVQKQMTYINNVRTQACYLKSSIINMDFIPYADYYIGSCMEKKNSWTESHLKDCAIEYFEKHRTYEPIWYKSFTVWFDSLPWDFTFDKEEEISNYKKCFNTWKSGVTSIHQIGTPEKRCIVRERATYFGKPIGQSYTPMKVTFDGYSYSTLVHQDHIIPHYGIGGIAWRFLLDKGHEQEKLLSGIQTSWDPCDDKPDRPVCKELLDAIAASNKKPKKNQN